MPDIFDSLTPGTPERKHAITIHLNDAEYAKVVEAAQAKGFKRGSSTRGLSEFARKATLLAAQSVNGTAQ